MIWSASIDNDQAYGGEENWKVNTVQHPCFFLSSLAVFSLQHLASVLLEFPRMPPHTATQSMSILFKYLHEVSSQISSFDVLPTEKWID